jgi:hypothetical protein
VADVTDTNVTVCGVNMFDLGYMAENYKGYSATYTDNSFSITGTDNGAYQMAYIPQKFYATGKITISGDSGWRIVVQPRDSEGNYLENAYKIPFHSSVTGSAYLATYHGTYFDPVKDANGRFELKITVPEEVDHFTIAFVMNKQTYTYRNFQVEVGSKSSYYTPYVADVISANIGSEIEQGSFDVSTGNETIVDTRARTARYATLQSGTYTISSTADVYIVMYVYDLYGNFIASESETAWVNSNTYTFTLIGKRNVRFGFRFPSQGVILPSDVTDVVLKCNDTDTKYIPNIGGTFEIQLMSPTMTLTTDKQGVNIECEYYLDGQAVIDELTDAIISLGGTI